MDCHRGRGFGCSRPGYGITVLRRSLLTPPQSHQELHRTGETDSWKAQTKPCVHQDTGESKRSSDPIRDDPDLPVSVQESLAEVWVSKWPVAGSGALSVAGQSQGLLKEAPFDPLPPLELERENEVTQSCATLRNPMDCSLPGSSVYGIFQARILEWACHFLLQGIFPTQGSSLGLPHCRQMLLPPGKSPP